jgi:hypothetical protein
MAVSKSLRGERPKTIGTRVPVLIISTTDAVQSWAVPAQIDTGADHSRIGVIAAKRLGLKKGGIRRTIVCSCGRRQKRDQVAATVKIDRYQFDTHFVVGTKASVTIGLNTMTDLLKECPFVIDPTQACVEPFRKLARNLQKEYEREHATPNGRRGEAARPRG